MPYSTSFRKRGGFIFDVDSVVHLCRIVRDYCGVAPTLRINLEGDHTIEDTDESILESDSYVRSNRIISLRIETPLGTPGRYAQVELSRSSLSAVEVRIIGEQTAAIALRSQLENFLQGRRQWYSWLYLGEGTLASAVSLLSLTVLCWVGVAVLHFVFWPESIKHDGVGTLIAFEGLLLGLVLLLFAQKMFPRLAFDIHKSGSVVRMAAGLRWFIFVAIGLALLVSLFSRFLWGMISPRPG